jgi:arsenate reductase
MAEGLWNHLGGGEWQAVSAGSNPAGYVHPLALQVMQESSIPLADARSKHLREFLNAPFDLVITVCDSAQESCPVFPGAKQTLHWPFEDPAHATGSDEEKLAVFRQVRDQIRQRISSYLDKQE